MIRQRLGPALAALLVPLAAAAGTSLPELPRHEIAVGEFVQRRHLPELERPLESRGAFAYAAGRGLLWEVREPVRSRLLIDPGGAVFEQGRRIAHGGPMAAIQPIFEGLFGGDVVALEQRFTLRHEGDAADWRLVLEPRDARLAAAIDAIAIEGAAEPRRLAIDGADGSRTEIVFRHVTHPAALDDEWIRAFDRARPGR